MKALISKIFFLTLLFTNAIQSGLRPDAENVCLQSEIYKETIIEKVKKPVTEYQRKMCGKVFKMFSCQQKVIKWKVVDEPRVVQKSRPVIRCCTGYKEIQENETKCVPECSMGCVHGKCTAPNKCTCVAGFHGPACSMPGHAVMATTTQEIFQSTEKSELEDLNLESEFLKITNTDFTTETAGEVTVSTAEATVSMTDAASSERTTMELNEKEIPKEKFQSAKFRVAVDAQLNLTRLITASTEETRLTAKYSNRLKDAVGFENGDSNSSEKPGIEGNEIPPNPTPILEFEEHALHPTEMYAKNLTVYDFTSLLYVLPVSCFVAGIALWIIVKRRKKITESQTEIQHPFYSKEPFEFCAENLSLSKLENSIAGSEIEPSSTKSILLGFSQSNRSESAIDMREPGPNNAKPLLKDFRDCGRSLATLSEVTAI